LRPTAHTTSSRPATTRISQARLTVTRISRVQIDRYRQPLPAEQQRNDQQHDDRRPAPEHPAPVPESRFGQSVRWPADRERAGAQLAESALVPGRRLRTIWMYAHTP